MRLHPSKETIRRLAEEILGREVHKGEHAEVLKLVKTIHEVLGQASCSIDLPKAEPIVVYHPEEVGSRIERKTAV